MTEEKFRYCKHCGQQMPITHAFCIKCGTPMNASAHADISSLCKAKDKWYYNNTLICCLFACWFLFFIPLLLGIFLLLKKQKHEEKLYTELQQLSLDNDSLNKMLTPELRDAVALQKRVSSLQSELSSLTAQLNQVTMEYDKKKKFLVSLDDEITVQEFGLYTPQFDFASALDYKEELAKVRARQKELIKNKAAVTGATDWTVNGNKAKGKKMVTDTQKLLLRAFNTECDEIVDKVKYTNFDASLHKMYASADTISNLGTIMNIRITNDYLQAKVKELRLAFEYRQKKQDEKEAARAAREEQREQVKVQRELEEQQKKFEKEQAHYQTAYQKLVDQLSAHPEDSDLLSKKAELENKLSDIDKALTDIDYRQANMKAGYVYVISNIGAFGENVYKIGMTRRLDPLERVDELGDASVPFKFDVHAMIFSDDAPALEAALHRAFENKKVNMVNTRREFFRVTLDEIKDVIRKNFDNTVEFVDVPDAEQYRVSMRMYQAAQ